MAILCKYSELKSKKDRKKIVMHCKWFYRKRFYYVRRGFRLPTFALASVVKNRGTLDKIGKLGNFEEVHLFPVSAPVREIVLVINTFVFYVLVF